MSNKSFLLSVIFFLATFIGVYVLSERRQPIVIADNLGNLPVNIMDMDATEDTFPASVYGVLNADKHVYRHYHVEDGRKVDLYIGYYGTAKGGRTGHNPNACLPGAGWGILESKRIELHSARYQHGVEVNYVLARRGEVYESVLHWYQAAGDKVLSTGIQMNIRRFIGKLVHNRADGAFVQVSTLSGGDGIKEADLLIRSFAQEILRLLPEYWPVEK